MCRRVAVWRSGTLQSAAFVFQHMLKIPASWGLGAWKGTADFEWGYMTPGKRCVSIEEQIAVRTPLFNYGFKNFFSLFYFIAKSIIQDLKKNFEIVKLVTGSLISCHRLAASVAGPGGLVGATLVDGRYTYREVPDFFTFLFHF